jgi:hypothetical protein
MGRNITLLLAVTALVAGCGGDTEDSAKGGESLKTGDSASGGQQAGAKPGVAIQWEQVPWESGLKTADSKWENQEAVVPPQCYTKTESTFNPCYTCHQTYPSIERPNQMNDGALQGDYAFSDYAMENHWKNLFVDRTEAVQAISDEAIQSYVRENNYTPLRAMLRKDSEYPGYVPDLKNLHKAAEAFDAQGFAKDGSGWVAFNYKPLPSTFWPTNGSTDDVMIRLPTKFRKAQDCSSVGSGNSRDVYMANLGILEMAIKDLKSITVPVLKESEVCADLNGDGDSKDTITEIKGLPSSYVGQAGGVKVHGMLYPKGTEFLHTVRYVGVDGSGEVYNPHRMKEVRYMRKTHFYSLPELRDRYHNERREKQADKLPRYTATGAGLQNSFGWRVLGFIEDADGDLRKQSHEEQHFCMGCHSTMGTTIDQTFAFPRKVTGAEGWGYIDLEGMADAPQVGETEGEIRQYLRHVGGGSEFRENPEMQARWFGDQDKVLSGKVRDADVEDLITPSRERALRLNKAYRLIVKNQTFEYGRDATVKPAENVYEEVPSGIQPLPEEKQYLYDIRLDWSASGK